MDESTIKRVVIAGAALLLLGVFVVTRLIPPSSRPPQVAGSGAKIETISTGDEVDIAAHLRPGTRTVVEFGAVW